MAVDGNSFSSMSRDLSKDRTVSGEPPKQRLDKVFPQIMKSGVTQDAGFQGQKKLMNIRGVSDFNSMRRP